MINSAATALSLVENSSSATVEIKNGSLTLNGNLTINAGTFLVDPGQLLKFTADSVITGSFSNKGTVEVGANHTLEIASSSVAGDSGVFKIDAGATLQLDHTIAENVIFSGSGTLVLENPSQFSGTVSDGTGSMTTGDVLDLIGFDTGAHVSYSGNSSGGTVTVTETGRTTAHIKVGANSTHWSTPVSDGHGGILIHDPPADDSPSAPAQPWTHLASDGFAFKPDLDGGALAGDLGLHPNHPDHSGLAPFADPFAHEGQSSGTAPFEGLPIPQDIKALLAHQHDFHFA
jgi:autotransporter-associated beta strand protein